MLRYLHGLENIKDTIVKFINYVLLAEEKDQTKFYDGHKLLKFSKRPLATKKSAWDFRYLPSLIISSSDATLETISLEKDYLGNTPTYVVGTDSPGPTGTDFEESGGEFNTSIRIDVYASTLEECDKLTDLFATMFSSPVAKDFLMRSYIRLPNNLRITEGGAVNLPNIDTPVYYNSLSFTAYGAWRMREYYGPKLAQLLFDLEFVQSINAKPKLISAELIEANKVRLTFDSSMNNDLQLISASNYVFSGASILTAEAVTLISSKIVDVTFSGLTTSNRSYQVSAYNLSSTSDVGIDTTSNTAAFFVH